MGHFYPKNKFQEVIWKKYGYSREMQGCYPKFNLNIENLEKPSKSINVTPSHSTRLYSIAIIAISTKHNYTPKFISGGS